MELLSGLSGFLHYFASFVLVISVIVFVHEFGHYYVARRAGVRIEVFSIGFGREIFGFNDRRGTRWKVSVLPFGGYVKMFGDTDPASNPDAEKISALTADERKVAFHTQSLARKAAIVVAGPLANFIFAILILWYFFAFIGHPQTLPVAGDVMEGGAAHAAGIKPGDRFVEIEGREIKRFSDIQSVVRMRPEEPLRVTLERGGEKVEMTLTPKLHETQDAFGNTVRIGLIGVSTSEVAYEKLPMWEAFPAAIQETYQICADTLTAIGQMIRGTRSVDELGGPIKIAKYSGQSTEKGVQTVLWFMALISINLGLINLFPIPLLDGGHLVYYAIEALQGRPLAVKIQEWGMRLGFAVLVTLMLFTTFNDISQLAIFGR